MESYKWKKINHTSVSRQTTSRAHSTSRGWNRTKKTRKTKSVCRDKILCAHTVREEDEIEGSRASTTAVRNFESPEMRQVCSAVCCSVWCSVAQCVAARHDVL